MSGNGGAKGGKGRRRGGSYLRTKRLKTLGFSREEMRVGPYPNMGLTIRRPIVLLFRFFPFFPNEFQNKLSLWFFSNGIEKEKFVSEHR